VSRSLTRFSVSLPLPPYRKSLPLRPINLSSPSPPLSELESLSPLMTSPPPRSPSAPSCSPRCSPSSAVGAIFRLRGSVFRCQTHLERSERGNDHHVHPSGCHHHRCGERARLRRVPARRRVVGSSSSLHDVRPCRVLRSVSEPARAKAHRGVPASHHSVLRAGRGLALVCGR
jgi:hypothetical protein